MERDREALETKQARLLSSTETLLENQKQMLERREEARAEQVQVNVYNVFYCFLTASPSFDSKKGTRKFTHFRYILGSKNWQLERLLIYTKSTITKLAVD